MLLGGEVQNVAGNRRELDRRLPVSLSEHDRGGHDAAKRLGEQLLTARTDVLAMPVDAGCVGGHQHHQRAPDPFDRDGVAVVLDLAATVRAEPVEC